MMMMGYLWRKQIIWQSKVVKNSSRIKGEFFDPLRPMSNLGAGGAAGRGGAGATTIISSVVARRPLHVVASNPQSSEERLLESLILYADTVSQAFDDYWLWMTNSLYSASTHCPEELKCDHAQLQLSTAAIEGVKAKHAVWAIMTGLKIWNDLSSVSVCGADLRS
jgi:hypothetical protein